MFGWSSAHGSGDGPDAKRKKGRMISQIIKFATYFAGKKTATVGRVMTDLDLSKVDAVYVLRAMGWKIGASRKKIGRDWVRTKGPDLDAAERYLSGLQEVNVPDTVEALGVSKIMAESILRTLGWHSMPRYMQTKAGGKACAWMRGAFNEDLHAEEKTDTLSPGGKVRPKSLRERKTSIKFTLSTPLCAPSPRDYELWRNAARSTTAPQFGYCTDCTPEYQAKMRSLNRCENTHVQFRPDPDDPREFEGYVPAEEQ